MGHLALHDESTYDEAYWAKYQHMADTDMGRALTQARIDLVARHYDGPLLDVGIGSGQFIVGRLSSRGRNTYGYDVNPLAIEWLKERALYLNLYKESVRALSFWDALEHIPDPGAAVARAGEWVFVSLPIFDGPEDCLASKHFRPGEHLWYWTHGGFVRWMERQGFECVEHNVIESDLGRDGIGSYAFRRLE